MTPPWRALSISLAAIPVLLLPAVGQAAERLEGVIAHVNANQGIVTVNVKDAGGQWRPGLKLAVNRDTVLTGFSSLREIHRGDRILAEVEHPQVGPLQVITLRLLERDPPPARP